MRVSRIALAALVACGSKPPPNTGVTTERCVFEPLVPTARAGAPVQAAPLMAGAAERVLDVPVGTALGGYTARAGFLGSSGVVDTRKIKLSGVFNPSIGVLDAPRVKAVALTAGDETVVIAKVDMIFVYEGMLFDLEQRLGPAFAGKVILASSHSHSAWAQYTGHGPLKLGAGQMRQVVYNRFLDTIEGTVRDALAAQRAAKIGVSFDGNFDPTNQINHNRRTESAALMDGARKDDHLYFIRIDGTDGTPIAAIPVFGEHGTLQSEDNPLASTDAPGALERGLEEQFDNQVVVMHLQSAGGNNSPSGHGQLDCNVHPGNASDPCLPWTIDEGHGRVAAPTMYAAWQAAGANMQDTLPISMVSRSIETGPDPKDFTIRNGMLAYAPFDGTTMPDGVVYEADGVTVKSPIDEFNAPVGAGLCESQTAMFPAAEIPGDDGILPYGSCLKLDLAGPILGQIFEVDIPADATHPVCETTRTTISALRIGDYVIATMPGELTMMLAQYMRSQSPLDEAHTILVGYSQGHVGYMLRPEDWLMGGYEPSVTFWGPLESEMIAERVFDLIPLALMSTRQDGTAGGTNKVATAMMTDSDVPAPDDPAPNAGTVPADMSTVPDTWSRTGHPTQAQPAATIPRVQGLAQFVWIGDDPLVQTPRVTLEMEMTPGSGVYVPATRRSGRVVDDDELPIAYTPEPLQRTVAPQTHVWVVEWQAVPWNGAPGLDSLDDRGGVPLGNYRFHVEGHGWTLDSQPFAVVPGGLAPSAMKVNNTITVTTSWLAPKGWRLMDLDLKSNAQVPVRSQQITFQLLDSTGAPISGASGTTNTDGNGQITMPDPGGAAMVHVTDRFGNSATMTIN